MFLKLTTPYMSGAAVRRWQETCIQLGFTDCNIEPDGIFGPATDAATRAVQRFLHVQDDGIVGPITWNAAELAIIGANPNPNYAWPVFTIDGVEIHDCRAVFKPPKNYTYDRLGVTISGVMLHRTACVLGENPKRWESINCHIGVTLSGKVILMHHFWRMIWHGNGPSPSTIGIEFDGNPEGIPGVFWKPGGGPHPITREQEQAADVLFSIVKKEIELIGGKLKYVLAHRQSSQDREYDPGWHCWQTIGLNWQNRIGIKSPVNRIWGTGKPIPKEWDPDASYNFKL